jgi:hypothetical protein
MALHVKLSSAFFEEYHIEKPIQFQVNSDAVLERMPRSKTVQIAMKQRSETLTTGEFDVRLEDLKALDTPLGESQNEDFKSELTIAKQGLEKILSDNKVNSDFMDIIATGDNITLESKNERGNYSREISDRYICKEPSKSRLYYLDYLIKCLKASKCDTIRLRNNGIFLITEFVYEPSVKLSLFLTCKPISEEKARLPCSGRCIRVFEGQKRGTYLDGDKRCDHCEIFLKVEGNRCPCCDWRLRCSPRKRSCKQHFVVVMAQRRRAERLAQF